MLSDLRPLLPHDRLLQVLMHLMVLGAFRRANGFRLGLRVECLS